MQKKNSSHRNCGILRRGIHNFAFEEDRGQRRDDLLEQQGNPTAAELKNDVMNKYELVFAVFKNIA